MKFVVSLGISVVLLVVAGVLYFNAGHHDEVVHQYHDAIAVSRQIQQLDASWSVETARVHSDPLADFDSLASFIPRMRQFKNDLSQTIREIPDLPTQLSNDISSYLSAVDAKEEHIERFKTSYAVVRNSVRYLPLAASTLIRLVEESNDPRLAKEVADLTQDINSFLAVPTEPEQRRLVVALSTLHDTSVTYPPHITNALANFVVHADVLVARTVGTLEIFAEAMDADVSRRTDRVVEGMEFEAAQVAAQGQQLSLGIQGSLATLAFVWVIVGAIRLTEFRVARRPIPGLRPARAPDVAVGDEAGAGPARAATEDPSPESRARPAAASEPEPAVEAADWVGLAPSADGAGGAPADRGPLAAVGAEGPRTEPAIRARPPDGGPRPVPQGQALYRIAAGFLSDSLAGRVHQVMARINHLEQSQERLREALDAGARTAIAPGLDLHEEIDTSFAVLSSMRRQVDGVGTLATRLAAFSAQRDREARPGPVDIGNCIDEACEAVRAESYATVTKRIGPIPKVFASRFDVLFMLEHVLDNAVLAVREFAPETGTITIDVVEHGEGVLITVADNGRGFEADEKSKILEPFYTTREHALGIGLPSAIYLANKYRGTLTVNSQPREGTVIRIMLPAGAAGETTIGAR